MSDFPFSKKRSYKEPHYPRYANTKLSLTGDVSKEHFRVVSYNIQYGEKIESAAKLILENSILNSADIICLQEMNPSSISKLASVLQYNYVYYPAAFHYRPRKDLGNAILSRWPIIKDQKIRLPYFDPTKPQRIAVEAVVEVAGRKISVCSIHLNVYSHPSHRRKQITKAADYLSSDSHTSIIAGDLNTFTNKNFLEIKKVFTSLGYEHASRNVQWTYQYWYLLNKRSTLDHIFSKNCRIGDSGMIEDKSASDHIPIWADLIIK